MGCVVNSLFMVDCPLRARRSLAATLSAALSFTAIASLTDATAAADALVLAKPGAASVSFSAEPASALNDAGSFDDGSRSKAPSVSHTTNAKPGGAKTELEERKEHFTPLVAGATTRWGSGVEKRLEEVTDEFENRGGTLGMAILDRETGEFICNAHCEDAFNLASLMKVFIADVVAYTNYTRPDGSEIEAGEGDAPVAGNDDAMARDDMIRYSNNEATASLWNAYGNDGIIQSVRERYGLSSKTASSGSWGSTTSSPADLVAYFDRMLAEEGGLSTKETRYLRQLLYSLPRYSYTGADQDFGLRKALPKETIGNKSGWYNEVHTTAGFLGDDARFAIAVLGVNLSGEDLTDAVSEVFPGGQVMPSEESDTTGTHPTLTEASADSAKVNPGLWALVAAAIGFSFGWTLRRQRTS